MAQPIYALILAGGSGERFWPLSRRSRPKQLLQLVSKRTLLEETVARLDGLVPKERILILTNVEQEKAVRDLLKDLPPENIVAEPAKRLPSLACLPRMEVECVSEGQPLLPRCSARAALAAIYGFGGTMS